MGMYTGLRCKVYVKEPYRPYIKALMNREKTWQDIAQDLKFIAPFAELERADMIPFGALAYMPDEWEDVPLMIDGTRDWKNAKATDGFERQFDEKTGYWAFQCSLKNYDDEIEAFFDHVLSHIVDWVEHLEKYYEEWIYSMQYDLVDGFIRLINSKFMKYGYDEEDFPDFWRKWS